MSFSTLIFSFSDYAFPEIVNWYVILVLIFYFPILIMLIIFSWGFFLAICLSSFLKKRFYLFIFREGEGRERGRERNIDLGEIHQVVASHATQPASQACALWESKQLPQFTGQHSVHGATAARALCLSSLEKCLFNFCQFFNGVFFLLLSHGNVSYVHPYQMICECFLPFFRLSSQS